MKLHPPTVPFRNASFPRGHVTQWFGENPHLYQQFGMAFHNGIDYVAPWNSPLYAIEDGTIVDVNDNPNGYGRHIRFISDFTDQNGRHRQWTYGHMEQIWVKMGDKVKAGDVVGTMGNTGFVVSGATPFWQHNPYAGTHLHLGVRMVRIADDGFAYPGSKMKFLVLDYHNGVHGFFDPKPIMDTINQTREQQLSSLSLTLQSMMNRLTRLITK